MRLLVHDVILLLLGDMSFAQALRPPMEERVERMRARCAGGRHSRQPGRPQLLDGGEVPITSTVW